MPESGGDLLLAQARPVIAFDQKRGPPALAEKPRPHQCAVQGLKFLERQALLVERRNRRRAAWPAISTKSHDCLVASLLTEKRESPGLVPGTSAGTRSLRPSLDATSAQIPSASSILHS